VREDLKLRKATISADELRVLWGVIDGDASGSIDAREFASFMRRCGREAARIGLGKVAGKVEKAIGAKDMGAIFATYDEQNTGFIPKDKFEYLVRNELKLTAAKLPQGEFDGLWSGVDEDKSGFVTMREFAHFIAKAQGRALPAATLEPTPPSMDRPKMNSAYEKRRVKGVGTKEKAEALDHRLLSTDPKTGFDPEWSAKDNHSGARPPDSAAGSTKNFEKRILTSRRKVREMAPAGGSLGLQSSNSAVKDPYWHVIPSFQEHGQLVQPTQRMVLNVGGGQKAKAKEAGGGGGGNNSGPEISPEFVAKCWQFMTMRLCEVKDPKLRGSWPRMFERYDVDRSGELDFSEWQLMMRKDLGLTRADFSPKELETLFSCIDTSGDGNLSGLEFNTFMKRCEVIAKTLMDKRPAYSKQVWATVKNRARKDGTVKKIKQQEPNEALGEVPWPGCVLGLAV